jgi:hypothetical protein
MASCKLIHAKGDIMMLILQRMHKAQYRQTHVYLCTIYVYYVYMTYIYIQ